jgi:MoaA/NifB/PqqE/SkfB family radical SAM enzyme
MNDNSLKFLTLNVTESCDAACLYCNWWQTSAESEPFDALAKAIGQAASMGAKAIRISGGEPLLRSDLPALIARIRELGLISMVCTAAKCGLETLISVIDAGLNVLSVSLDTLQPQLFRRIRGYEIKPVLENVDYLAESRTESDYEIVLSVVLTRLSTEGLGDVIKYAQSRDLVVNITPYQSDAPERGATVDELAFRDGDESLLRGALRIVKDAAASGVRIINSDKYLDGIADYMINRRLPAGHSCRTGDSSAIRMAGGKLKLCHSLTEIKGADLAAAWSSEDAAALRKRMALLDCPGCWLSCHADARRPVAHRYGRREIWDAL